MILLNKGGEEMAEDTKKIARLDFDIEKALSGLDKIDNKLKTISESSEKYAKNIGLAINSGVDYKTIAKSKLFNI